MVTLAVLRSYRRFVVVLYQFFPLIVAYLRDRRRFILFGRSRSVDRETQVERAELLLESLLTLGPTFIKLGQLLSTRPDVLPPAYIEVLSSLQDEVPPAPWSEARTVLEDELGPVDDVFDDFDTDALSGASLGQVYRATYRGDPVAVKVRRPNIEALVEADLRVVRWSLPIVRRFIGEGRAFSLSNLADEFARTIRQEMDYDREGRMLNEIRENFADYDGIRIPETHDDVSGPRVLTMEYVPGVKITDLERLDAMGVDRTALAEQLQRIYLQMIVDDGVFHADPHPGNLAVDDDGSLIFYDFGMSGRVEPFIQQKIIDFYIAIAEQDIDGILDALIEMGTLSPEADREVMGQVMELAIADVRGEEIEQYRVQQVIQQVEDTIYEFPLRLPRNLALVLRVATVVEGVCVTLDEEFDFIEVATDYLAEQGYREESVRRIAGDVSDQLRASARSLVTVPPKLEGVLDDVDRGNVTVNVRVNDEDEVFEALGRRVVYGLFGAAGTVATALLYADVGATAPTAVAAAGTVCVCLLLWRSFRARRGIRAVPQFTRQSMRRRRGDEDGGVGPVVDAEGGVSALDATEGDGDAGDAGDGGSGESTGDGEGPRT